MRQTYIYCDICDCPISGEAMYLMLYSEKDISGALSGSPFTKKMTKEICSSCKLLVDDIFKLKKKKLKDITDKIEATYKLKVKQRRIKRNKKE